MASLEKVHKLITWRSWFINSLATPRDQTTPCIPYLVLRMDIDIGMQPWRSWMTLSDHYRAIRSRYLVWNIELAEAFDSVHHRLLLHRLSSRSAHLLLWLTLALSSYLTGLVHQVKKENILSEPLPLSSNVPQCSTLGSVLFSIYANNVAKAVGSYWISSYAEDIMLYTAGPALHSTAATPLNITSVELFSAEEVSNLSSSLKGSVCKIWIFFQKDSNNKMLHFRLQCL